MAAAGHVARLGTAAALMLTVAAAGGIAAARVTDHHLETVVTGSMQPQIPVGALVVTERVAASRLRPGDVIAFAQPCNPNRTIVHRIVLRAFDGAGNVDVTTKGDANPGPDHWPTACNASDTTGTLVLPASASADRVVYILGWVGVGLDAGRRAALVGLIALGLGATLTLGYREVRRYRFSRTLRYA